LINKLREDPKKYRDLIELEYKHLSHLILELDYYLMLTSFLLWIVGASLIVTTKAPWIKYLTFAIISVAATILLTFYLFKRRELKKYLSSFRELLISAHS